MQFEFSNTDFSYQIFQSTAEDRTLVDFYCQVVFSSATDLPYPREILPFPRAEFSFYLKGGALTVVNGTEEMLLSSSYFFGQPTATRNYKILPGTVIFFVRLKQHLVKSLMADHGPWRDCIIPLEDMLDKDLFALFGELDHGNSFEDNTAIAQHAIKTLLTRVPDENWEWLQAVDDAIGKSNSVSELAEQLHVSTRQLERRFQAYFECTPNEYMRLKKLAEALDHYARNASSSITDASYEGGFADQAHFIKTFRLFTSTAPLRFFRNYNIKKK